MRQHDYFEDVCLGGVVMIASAVLTVHFLLVPFVQHVLVPLSVIVLGEW